MARCSLLFFRPFHGPAGDDRWAWRRGNTGRTSWVLCDGASESFDGAGWAKILAESLALRLVGPSSFSSRGYHTAEGQKNVAIRIDPADLPNQGAREARRRYRRERIPQLASHHPGMEWLNQVSLARGSWSTALAVRISPFFSHVDVWALGDTELFVLDGWQELLHLPLQKSSDFTIGPPLIASSDGGTVLSWWYRRLNLRSLRRPRLVLVSDTLASYILEKQEAGDSNFLREILTLTPENLACRLSYEETTGRLRRDDHSLLEVIP